MFYRIYFHFDTDSVFGVSIQSFVYIAKVALVQVINLAGAQAEVDGGLFTLWEDKYTGGRKV